MKHDSLKTPWLFSADAFPAALAFLASGFLAGALFNWLAYTPALEEFFYIPYTARKARFSWFMAASAILAFGLMAGFLVSSRKIDFRKKLNLSPLRSLSAFALVCMTVPLIYLSAGAYADRLLRNYSLIFYMMLACPPIVALAMCVLTKSWRRLPIAFLASLIFGAVSFAATAAAMLILFALLDEPSQFALDFVFWTFLYSSLSLCFGWWVLRRAREE
jgi:hypothetical protein